MWMCWQSPETAKKFASFRLENLRAELYNLKDWMVQQPREQKMYIYHLIKQSYVSFSSSFFHLPSSMYFYFFPKLGNLVLFTKYS